MIERFARGLVRAGSTNLPRYFNAEEVNQILSSCPSHKHKVLVHFLWKTGVRVSEALSLRWQDVNFYDKHVRVVTLKKSRRKVRGRKPVREHERIIPIDDALASDLLLWQKENDNERVFPWDRSWAYRLVKEAVLSAGFDEERAHPHTFRHSFAVHLLKNGVPITVVQQMLGHSSIENTLIYTAIVQQEAAAFLRDVKW